jgi:hypothetical protein
MSQSQLADNEKIGLESFAGWSFRIAIRPILGPDLALTYENAIRTGRQPGAEDKRQHGLFRFASEVKLNPSAVQEAATKWLEPHFNTEDARVLVAFAGAVRRYPSVFAVHSPK